MTRERIRALLSAPKVIRMIDALIRKYNLYEVRPTDRHPKRLQLWRKGNFYSVVKAYTVGGAALFVTEKDDGDVLVIPIFPVEMKGLGRCVLRKGKVGRRSVLSNIYKSSPAGTFIALLSTYLWGTIPQFAENCEFVGFIPLIDIKHKSSNTDLLVIFQWRKGGSVDAFLFKGGRLISVPEFRNMLSRVRGRIAYDSL